MKKTPQEDIDARREELRRATRAWLMRHYEEGDRPSSMMRAIPQLDAETVYSVWQEYLTRG